MSAAAIVGYVAAAMSVAGFTPQAWKIIKTRDTSGLATPMWILEVSAFAMWIVYGVLLGEWPIIVPNVLCFVISSFILVMKVVSHPTKHKIADAIDPAA
jgi:MtN3 and saliva related transmembrane protein